jgi:hypothetical protein
MPATSDLKPKPDLKPRRSGEMFDWFTVSYRTIYTVAALVILLGGAGAWYFLRTPPVPSPPPKPETTAPTSTARFTSLAGSVKVKMVGSPDWRDAAPETVLRTGDLVRTGRESAAEMTFFDGTVVHVRPDSLITIEETTENPQTKKPSVRWNISSGAVNLYARNSAEVITPTLRVRQEADSTGAIRVAQGGESEVQIFKGAGNVETRTGQRVSLGSNEAVRVDATGQAGAKVALPAVPQLVLPADEADLLYANPAGATTTLQWGGVQGAEAYRVMVDSNPQFFRPLVDQVHDGTQVRLRGLDVGKYYWRVSAVGKNRTEGGFSGSARFAISRPAAGAPAPPPPLTLEALDVRGSVLQVKGQTESGATVTINGEAIQVRPDGTFIEFIGLEKVGKQDVKIRVVGLNGGVREDVRSVVVAF